MSYRLGINLGFAVNKFCEPEEWTKIVAQKLGLLNVQFVADLLNPFLPGDYIAKHVRRISQCIQEYGITIESLFTSTFTRVNHLMSNDAEQRKIWYDWFLRFLEMGSAWGAKSLGSHFGILTFAAYDDVSSREYLVEDAVKSWQNLSFAARELGYEYLLFEPMSVAREMANTVAETKELLDRVNDHCGVPMRVCLDVGHAAHPSERDPYPWIEQLGAVSPVIHLQQTVLHRSNHAPFTEEHNRDGLITGERVMEAVKKSGCKTALFALEISHREHYDYERRIIPDLEESVRYWKKYIPTQELGD